MKIDSSIFKAYDIRGIYPDQIDRHLAFQIGVAFVNYFQLKNVALGRDGRTSSPTLAKAVADGMAEAGANVVDIGIVSSDALYFTTGYYPDIDGGIMITASHNPKEYNGFKMCLKNAVPVSGEKGIMQMRDMIVDNSLKFSEKNKGSITRRDIFPDFSEKLFSIIDIEKIKPFRVVVDAGNGVAGYVIDKIFKNLPAEIIPLYFEIDGTFPNHQPSPIEEHNLVDIKKKVVEEEADFGLAFDGDGDRVYLIDGKGNAISATITSAIIIRKMLEEYPDSHVLYNLICGWIVPETIENLGGTAIKTRVGHSIIKAKMRETDAVFACEHSGHYFFKDLYYADSGMLASLIVLELVSKLNKPLSEIVADFDKYHLSGEINSKVSDQTAKLDELKARYHDGKQSEMDGLSVEYHDWRFNVRPSNTEPLLRLNVEAKTKELMEAKRDELLQLIHA